jgi:hypothetical protein
MSTKLPDLTEVSTPADDDLLYTVDVSDTTDAADGSSKYVQVKNLRGGPQTAAESLASVTPTNLEYAPGNVLRYGTNTTPGTTDMTAAFQAAFDAAGEKQGVYVPPGRYFVEGVITCSISNTYVFFDACRIDIGDGGTEATLINTADGVVGFHWSECDSSQVIGSATFIGQGTLGTTSLAGMVFDNCDDMQVPCFMRFENMAAGRFIQKCTRCHFGDVHGKDIDGLQTFEDPPSSSQGSLEVVNGTTWSSFGDCVGNSNVTKPARYLSVATGSSDNTNNTFGATVSEGSGESESHPLALRSAVDCTFGSVTANDCKAGVFIVQYVTDDSYSVDRNHIDSLVGDFPSTGSSVDAAIIQETAATAEIGTTSFGSVDVTCAGEFGIFVTSGTVNIGRLTLAGAATRPLAVYANTGRDIARLNIDHLQCAGPGSSPSWINVGDGGKLSIGYLDLPNGPTSAVTAAVRYDPALGTHSDAGIVHIDSIYYRQNGSANDFTYVFMDLTNGFEQHYIGNIDGTGSTDQGRFGSDTFSLIQGEWARNAIPTTGTYSQGSVLRDVSPTVSSNGFTSVGWRCTSAGTPGTWTPIYSPSVSGAGESVTTTNVITAAESGTTFYLNAAGGFTSTLPAPANGLKYTFIVSTAPTTAYIVTTTSGANLLYGTYLDIVGELTYFSAQDTLNFVASTSVVGDRLEVESDGTNWYCKAFSGANGGITVAVT